jgi:DNA-binding XRE family transcriptional regulator
MTIQVIEKDGKPEWAVIPYEAYQRLLADSEMLEDIHDYDDAKQAVADGEDLVPSEVTFAIIDGENPIRVWREHRNMTQEELASQVGITPAHLSEVETGKLEADDGLKAAIATALNLDVEDMSYDA